MITTLAWVPRNSLKAVPKEAEITEEQAQEMMQNMPDGMMEEEEEDEGGATQGAKPRSRKDKKGNDILDELKMDAYDEEEEGVNVFLGGQKLTMHKDNEEDPYITLRDPDDSDDDEAVIKSSDFVLLAGITDQEYSSVEVHVYDKSKSSIYVHHDFVLPSFPLSAAYISTDADGKGGDSNFVAVGTFEPGIEIWNLDIVNAMEPTACLGGREAAKPFQMSKTKRGGKKKKKSKRGMKDTLLGALKKGSHSAGVMCLSWNTHNKSCLASGSADKSMKLWDIPKTACTSTFGLHKDKVQACEWNPVEAPILLSGGYDQKCACIDVRDAKSVRHYKVDGEVHSVSWNPANAAIFAASTDKGMISFFDVRKAGSATKPLFTIGAHDAEVGSISFNAKYNHLLASCSEDQTVKLWDLQSKPVCLDKKEMQIGQIFTMKFNPEDPDILAAAGSQGTVAIWDIASSTSVAQKYGSSKPQGRRRSSKK